MPRKLYGYINFPFCHCHSWDQELCAALDKCMSTMNSMSNNSIRSSRLNNFNCRVLIYLVQAFESQFSSFQPRCSSFKLALQVSIKENKERKSLSRIFCLPLLFKLFIPVASPLQESNWRLKTRASKPDSWWPSRIEYRVKSATLQLTGIVACTGNDK